MDCQEWKDKDLSEGYKQFSQDLDQVHTQVDNKIHGINIWNFSIQLQLQLDVLHLILQKLKKTIQKV